MDNESTLLLSAHEMMRLLDIARSTLYLWDQEGRIPRPVKIGSRVYWRRDEMNQWVAAGCPPREKWQEMKDNEV